MRDSLYQKDEDLVEAFRFDESVAEVFADMVQRSVPGYSALLSLIGVIANQFATAGSNCFDLGCSLGGATLAIDKATSGRNCHIYGIDNSEPMLAQAQSKLTGIASNRVQWVCEDLLNTNIQNASLVVLNLTLQFVAPKHRRQVVEKIYQGLLPGGALLISEKVKFASAAKQQRFSDLYYGFKRANSYSELEIAHKRNALEEVMILDTPKTHLDRLADTGFSSVEQCFQAFNFVSYLAIK
ncbi:MAG: carboxy-S-adenosyl-L-methionine synthase CmoA [Planctomycetota bacterium]|nr:carboxy-S-adenosyl-L-methionine synthase CmoA [Planctomycetota bacterium]